MPGIITVDELTRYITLLFERSELLSSLQIKGALADLKRHSSGHVYFSLTGDGARVACVLFRSEASRIPSWPREGDDVLVEGRAGVYGPRGSYQIYARKIRPLGEGAQARAKKELLQRLTSEGLFDPAIKRVLPSFPEKVAIVTSPTGAAVRDVLKVSGNRFPQCELVIVPVMVQGAESAEQIVQGLSRAGNLPRVEAVMLVRGGGSREDLNPFDDEDVVRAVRACPFPVVTGLGHQIDRTLADMAADMDAPTPSAAAEILFPSRGEILGAVNSSCDKMTRIVTVYLEQKRTALENTGISLTAALERSAIKPSFELLARLDDRIRNVSLKHTALAISGLESITASLDALSPLKVLARGFSSCSDPGGALISSARQVALGDRMHVRFRDGNVLAEVTETHPV